MAGRGWRAALVLATTVVALDQAVKAVVRDSIQPGERIDLVFGIELVRVSNEGIAFGLLGDGGTLVLAITIVALAAMLVWFALSPTTGGVWIAIGLLAGGALGNLIDRLRLDGVTDFIDPPLWPAFNIADIAITFGAVALVLTVFWGEADTPEPKAG